MHRLIYILLIVLFTSCFGSPTDEPKKDVELLQLWSVNHGTAGDAPPIVHEDKIIMSGGLFVYALNKDTGEEIWKYQFEDDNILQGRVFLINGDQVAVAHTDKIRAWNISNGSLEWEFDYETNDLKPRLTGKHISFLNKFAFTSENSKLFILDMSGNIKKIKYLDNEFGVQGLAYNSNKIYVAQGTNVTGLLTLGRVTVLNAQTGDSLWVYNTERSGVSAAPKIEEGALYVGTRGNSPENTFVALDAETGELIWEYTNSNILTRNFIVGPKFVYINSGGTIFALNKENGSFVWEFSWTSSTLVKPIYLEGYIYHSDHNRLFVVDAETGELVHEEPSPGGFIWHIAASSNKIFVQVSSKLIAYQPWHLRE
ncbi:MAG: PQQ-binding-like beta-propeller repeat protein [Balneolaceae bacterium]|nr:PQQ-binding-like beta-propeller repeat protein [Balneolaceae bacterium]MBO6546883.1 PQQ-binding-like beta-propeller repeat protein [Balneolaceae bacterium]MBO6649243.1 PQQ-binding-like beta-propeller repeat protein [Balneolaceae bacterium]